MRIQCGSGKTRSACQPIGSARGCAPGADGIPRNVVAPFLGLAVLVSSAWASVTAFGALPDDVSRALAIFALVPAVYLVAWPFSGNESTGREPLLEYLRDVIWLAGPLLSGALYAAI